MFNKVKKTKIKKLIFVHFFGANQRTKRQTEAVAVKINRPHGCYEHSLANWDWTTFCSNQYFSGIYIVSKARDTNSV